MSDAKPPVAVPGPNLKIAGEAFIRIARVLSDDCVHAIDTATSPAARHSYVRTMFAFVEGMTYAFKQVALARHLDGPPFFSEGEVALLREEAYELDERGVRTVQKFVRLTDNVRFAYRAFATAERLAQRELDVGGEGWAAFRKAVLIRNRLTHPKGPDDLRVSEEDLTTVQTAMRWFQGETIELLVPTKPGSEMLRGPN